MLTRADISIASGLESLNRTAHARSYLKYESTEDKKMVVIFKTNSLNVGVDEFLCCR